MWNAVAVALALLIGLLALLLPLNSWESTTSFGDGSPPVVESGRSSLLDSEGFMVLIPLLIPAVIVAVPLAFRPPRRAHRARVTSLTLLGVFIILGAMSIGVLFVPVFAVMVAAVVTGSDRTSGRRAAHLR